MWDVFVSYSTYDRAAGDLIVADLRAAGLAVWYDKDYIIAGDRVREAINKGIKKSRSFLLLASRFSIRSRWVLNELDAAMVREIEERRKVVIPLLLGQIKPSELPTDLRGKNWIDLRGNFKRRYRNCRSSLQRAIAVIVEPQDQNRSVMVVGKETTGRVLSYRYKAAGEKSVPDDNFLDDVIKLFLKTPSKLEGSHQRKHDFIKNYGRWGGRQLLKFFLDRSKLKFTQWFTEKDLGMLFHEINTFLMMYDVQKLAQTTGYTLLMAVGPGRSMAFRLSRHHRPNSR